MFELLRPRRWFRFRLRSLFVLLTLIAVWLGWNAHVVHERKVLLNSLSKSDFVLPPVDVYAANTRFTSRVSFVREWLGDTPVGAIVYTPGADLNLMRRWFPEASVIDRTREN